MEVSTVRNTMILIIIFILSILAYSVWQVENTPPKISYSDFLESIEKDEITRVTMTGDRIIGTDTYGRQFTVIVPARENPVPKMIARKISIQTEEDKPSFMEGFWGHTFPILLLIIVGIFMVLRRTRPAKVPDFAKTKAVKTVREVTFDDVAGISEAKIELVEIVDFLKAPGEFTRLGGRIPKGVLLQGPPGTGKTLMARAIAGEAGVPFFSISGSDFVEMFVGVGASRVRDLFKEAKKSSPCIVFIDEIDAVGGHRGAAASQAGGQDERQQTLNALLVEMDGFQTNETVVVVAATNRPDILDPALLRPGRFDRQVSIMPPDVKGRKLILDIYAAKVIMAPNVDLEIVAAMTPGFTGADLANLVNESALTAARRGKNAIELADLEEAKDKVLMGSERKELVISRQERNSTAFHEAGHALLAYLLPETDPIHKITIIPRGKSMGMTQQMPIDDRHAYSKEYLTNRIKILLGGRVAEELVFNQYTTGACNDLQTATEIATRMICEWGMGDTLGPRAYSQASEGYLGESSRRSLYSEETARAIDAEINRIIDDCYQEAVIILEGKINYLHKLAEYLLANETIDAGDLDIIINCPKIDEELQEMEQNQIFKN